MLLIVQLDSVVASWVSKLHRIVKKIPRRSSRPFTSPLSHQANQKCEAVKNKSGPSCQKESLSFWQLSMRKHEVCLHFGFSEGLHVLATNSFTSVESYLALRCELKNKGAEMGGGREGGRNAQYLGRGGRQARSLQDIFIQHNLGYSLYSHPQKKRHKN